MEWISPNYGVGLKPNYEVTASEKAQKNVGCTDLFSAAKKVHQAAYDLGITTVNPDEVGSTMNSIKNAWSSIKSLFKGNEDGFLDLGIFGFGGKAKAEKIRQEEIRKADAAKVKAAFEARAAARKAAEERKNVNDKRLIREYENRKRFSQNDIDEIEPVTFEDIDKAIGRRLTFNRDLEIVPVEEGQEGEFKAPGESLKEEMSMFGDRMSGDPQDLGFSNDKYLADIVSPKDISNQSVTKPDDGENIVYVAKFVTPNGQIKYRSVAWDNNGRFGNQYNYDKKGALKISDKTKLLQFKEARPGRLAEIEKLPGANITIDSKTPVVKLQDILAKKDPFITDIKQIGTVGDDILSLVKPMPHKSGDFVRFEDYYVKAPGSSEETELVPFASVCNLGTSNLYPIAVEIPKGTPVIRTKSFRNWQ